MAKGKKEDKYFRIWAIALPPGEIIKEKDMDTTDAVFEFTPDDIKQIDWKNLPVSLEHEGVGVAGKVVDSSYNEKDGLAVLIEIALTDTHGPRLEAKKTVIQAVESGFFKGVSTQHVPFLTKDIKSNGDMVFKQLREISLVKQGERPGSNILYHHWSDKPFSEKLSYKGTGQESTQHRPITTTIVKNQVEHIQPPKINLQEILSTMNPVETPDKGTFTSSAAPADIVHIMRTQMEEKQAKFELLQKQNEELIKQAELMYPMYQEAVKRKNEESEKAHREMIDGIKKTYEEAISLSTTINENSKVSGDGTDTAAPVPNAEKLLLEETRDKALPDIEKWITSSCAGEAFSGDISNVIKGLMLPAVSMSANRKRERELVTKMLNEAKTKQPPVIIDTGAQNIVDVKRIKMQETVIAGSHAIPPKMVHQPPSKPMFETIKSQLASVMARKIRTEDDYED